MKTKLILLALVASATLAQAKFYRTLYVDKGGSNTAPYDSLATAATEIQSAVDEANVGDTVIVYDNGTPYNFGYTATPGYTAPNRVVITKNITVRSPSGTASTVISGTPQFISPTDPKVRCVYMTAGTLKGFIIEKGTANTDPGNTTYDQSGGGVFLSGTAKLENCIVRDCTAINDGGGTYGGTLLNCTISDNVATNHGGGTFLGILTDCALLTNSATYGGGNQQGILTNCTLSGNAALNGGGCNSATLTDCILSGNSASSYGGGSRYSTLNGCSLLNNSAQSSGGGCYYGSLTNCTLNQNTASSGGGSCNATLVNCTLTGNVSGYYGGGAYNSTLTRCLLSENVATNFGGGATGGTLIECTITKNRSTDGNGGGVYNASLDRCLVSGNSAYGEGGGVYGFSAGSSATNSIITGNSAIWGGGAYGDVVLHNCTIKDNSATNDGGGVGTDGKLYNCIVVDNQAGGSGNDLYNINAAYASCSPDLTQGSNSCITNAPKFADLQLHLRADSPCIDAGVQQGSIGSDFDGLFRPLDGTGDGTADIDMGAHEFASALVDSDGDGLNDAQEVELGTDIQNTDTDGDGRSDGDEVAQGFSPTYNEAPAIAMGEENILNDPAAYDLYTTNSIQDLNLGLLMLQTSNGVMNLSMQLQTTSDLTSTNWNDAGTVEWQYAADAGKAFFRIRSE